LIPAPIAPLLALVLTAAGPAPTTAAADAAAVKPTPWADALSGTWDAQGGGTPGQGNGEVSFTRELGGRTVVRRNTVTYPAAKDRPAATHEDLLVIFVEGDRTRALYLDAEGHVIRYLTEPSPPGTLVLVSEPGPGPRFRLTHDWTVPGTLRIAFEMAPPGGAGEFKVYAEGRATRRR
jgi:hypothetical protein